MKKTQAIWTAFLMMGFVVFGTNVAYSDSAPATGADAKSEQSDINKNDHGAQANCIPSGQGGAMPNDQAVGNDNPMTKNSQSKKDETAATAPCPEGQDQKNAQPSDSINQGSTDKGGAGSPESAPNSEAGPDNQVK